MQDQTLNNTGGAAQGEKSLLRRPMTEQCAGSCNAGHFTEKFNLVQIHNLTDWRENLEALREMKAEGIIRHIGITTSHGRRHREFEQIMTAEDIDFVQLTYNITHREVESRLLPLAAEKGIAVIANRPFDGGSLVKGLKNRDEPLPEWAEAECGCTT